MIYRNIKTGAEIILKSVIISPNFELVEKKTEKKVVSPEPIPYEAPKKEEPPKVEAPIKKEQPKKRSAPKKKGTKK